MSNAQPSSDRRAEAFDTLDRLRDAITTATLINNKRAEDFFARSETLDPDLMELATITMSNLVILEQKIQLLTDMVDVALKQRANGSSGGIL